MAHVYFKSESGGNRRSPKEPASSTKVTSHRADKRYLFYGESVPGGLAGFIDDVCAQLFPHGVMPVLRELH
jgi:hypothetical protein